MQETMSEATTILLLAVTFSVKLQGSSRPEWVDTSIIRRVKVDTINICLPAGDDL